MSGLPKGWVEARLGDVVEPRSEKADPATVPNLPFLGLEDVEAYSGRVVGYNRTADMKSSVVLFSKGDLLFGRLRPYLQKILIADCNGAASAEFIVMKPNRYNYLDFLSSLLRSGKFLEYTTLVSSGDRPRVSYDSIADFSLSLPPLAEQKRIVAKLDALNAKSARARTELARIETLVYRYKQAVLSKAFSGELTSDFDRGTSVAQLDADAEVTPLWSIPETWSWCRTDQIGRVGLGRQRSPKNHVGSQMHPYLRSANITWQGVNTSDVKEMNFDDADFKRFKLEVGDVLLNEGSGSAKEVGKPAIWRGEITDCCYQNTILRVQPRRCSSEYAYYYFLLTARTGRFVSSTQGVNIQHIGREGLAHYSFPLAPEREQHEIVRRIESAFAKIDRLSEEAKRALQLVGKLDEAILAKAFRGELVPQDENDEPAEHLLARIRAERLAAPKPRRGRKAKA